VPSSKVRRAAVPLSDMLQRLRDLPPLSGLSATSKLKPAWAKDAPSINDEATRRRQGYLRAAVSDIGGDELDEDELEKLVVAG
jgi:hypothetical protein